MACGCRAPLRRFAARLLEWHGLRLRRPNLVTEVDRCEVCGRIWRFEAKVTPDG